MKRNIEVSNNEKMIRCCICGKRIPFNESCNPEPFVKGEDARCCHRCDSGYVIPSRKDPTMIDLLQDEAKYVKMHNDYMDGVIDAFGVMSALIGHNMNDSIFRGIETIAKLYNLKPMGDIMPEVMTRSEDFCEELGIEIVNDDDDDNDEKNWYWIEEE